MIKVKGQGQMLKTIVVFYFALRMRSKVESRSNVPLQDSGMPPGHT